MRRPRKHERAWLLKWHLQATQKTGLSILCSKQVCAFESDFSASKVLQTESSSKDQAHSPGNWLCCSDSINLQLGLASPECVSSSLGFRKSKPQRCPKAISLPLKLVSEQSWLVFTWSLQGWRWLGRPDTVLNQAPQENKKCLQSMSQSVNLETLLGEAGHVQIHRVSVPDCSPGYHSYHSSCANISAEILQPSHYSKPSKLPLPQSPRDLLTSCVCSNTGKQS